MQPAGTPNGPRILFVHGLWHGAWCWQEHFFDYFSRCGYSVYALDFRGHGRSPREPRFDGLFGYRLSEYLDDLATVVDHLGDETIVIGHSMGGYLTQKLLESRNVRLGILLASLPPWGISTATWSFATKHPWRFLSVLLQRSLRPVVSHHELVAKLFLSHSDTTETSRRLFASLGPESFRVFVDALWPFFVNRSKIKSPIEVIASSNDAFVSVKDACRTAAAYNTNAHIIEGGGHDMMLGDRWIDVAHRIDDVIATYVHDHGQQPTPPQLATAH